MSKRKHRFRIIRLKATPAEPLGYVEATDEQAAIAEAIKAYGITEPWKQKSLMAIRTR